MEQGEVSIRVGLDRDMDRKALQRFEIQDTGIGLPEDHNGQLFAPFIQADSSTTRKFGGTGLGLAISRQLVEMMGGNVEQALLAAHSIKGVAGNLTACNLAEAARQSENRIKSCGTGEWNEAVALVQREFERLCKVLDGREARS